MAPSQGYNNAAFAQAHQNIEQRAHQAQLNTQYLQTVQNSQRQPEANVPAYFQNSSNEPVQHEQWPEEGQEDEVVGVIKIKDGLFICDEYGAQDLEFVVANKVSRVVNTAGTQLNNFWEQIGVLYLTLNWQDDEKQTLFDPQESIADEIYRYIDEAISNHESVLVQSVKAHNRACFVICAWLMRRYRWSCAKTMQFMQSRRPGLNMCPSFHSQLQVHERKLAARGLGPKSSRWSEVSDSRTYYLENEELIIRNTYLNSQTGPIAPDHPTRPKKDKLVWRDLADPTQLLWEENRDSDDLVNLVNPAKQQNHRTKPSSNLKSKLKGTSLHQQQSKPQAPQRP